MFKKIYGSSPIEVCNIECLTDEMFFYQYLPISLAGSGEVKIPDRLIFLKNLVIESIIDFVEKSSDSEFVNSYIYLTAKRLYITNKSNLNRKGWHSDGFGTDDINYIWSDKSPTQYITGVFEDVPTEDLEALSYFEKLGNEYLTKNKVKKCSENTLYRLDDTVIHAVSEHLGEPTVRTFVKISFSKEKYNLKGNSHNYLLNYKWEMKDRKLIRNHPNI